MAAQSSRIIVALAFGTLGDVIPVAVIVAKALVKVKQGSSITFITHAAHEKFLRGPLELAGVAFKAISTPPVLSACQVHESAEGAAGQNTDWRKSLDDKHHKECLEAVDNVFGVATVGSQDLILFNFFALEGWHLAELYGVPCVVAAPYVVPYSAPSSFEREFRFKHGLLYERLKHASNGEVGWPEVMHWMWPLFTQRWTAWRTQSLQMSPYPLTDPVTWLPVAQNWPRAPPLLYGFSDAVVECPGYWPSSVHVCGFWFAPLDWWGQGKSELPDVAYDLEDYAGGTFTPPLRLLQFLGDSKGQDESQQRPIFFGMSSVGSMGLMEEPGAMVEVLKQVLQASGQRAILLTSGHPPLDSVIMSIASSEADGKEDITSTSPSCAKLSDGFAVFGGRLFCYSGFVPYTWLFPQCLLAMHHGGSGSTAAALVSGIPQIICPFLLDQFYWAERMSWIGVAPQPIKPAHLFPSDKLSAFHDSVSTILKAIKEAMSRKTQACSVNLALHIRKQDGIQGAVSVLRTALPRSS